MLVYVCRKGDGTKSGVSDAEIAREMIQALCCQIELARSIRNGANLSSVQDEEARNRTVLHKGLRAIHGFEACLSTTTQCYACEIIKAVDQMGRSEYAEECAFFMRRTRGNPALRSGYDFSAAFSDFRESAGTALCTWVTNRFLRAEAFCRALQGLAKARQPVVTHTRDTRNAQIITGGLSQSVDDLIASTWRKMAALDGSFLRIVR